MKDDSKSNHQLNQPNQANLTQPGCRRTTLPSKSVHRLVGRGSSREVILLKVLVVDLMVMMRIPQATYHKSQAQACGARVFERGDIVISCLDGHPDGDDDTKGNYNDPYSGEKMIMTLFVTHREGACSC